MNTNFKNIKKIIAKLEIFLLDPKFIYDLSMETTIELQIQLEYLYSHFDSLDFLHFISSKLNKQIPHASFNKDRYAEIYQKIEEGDYESISILIFALNYNSMMIK